MSQNVEKTVFGFQIEEAKCICCSLIWVPIQYENKDYMTSFVLSEGINMNLGHCCLLTARISIQYSINLEFLFLSWRGPVQLPTTATTSFLVVLSFSSLHFFSCTRLASSLYCPITFLHVLTFVDVVP